MEYQTIKVRFEEANCFIQFNRPEAQNTINNCMIEEFSRVLERCETESSIVVLEGLPDVFCFGADFQDIHDTIASGASKDNNPENVYNLWKKLATGPYITIAHVRGKANAGGLGFVAASDIVLADSTAVFSLSELLFGIFPALVLPFLVKRMGFQKAHYMTVMTQKITVEKAHAWGLVDAYEKESQHLLRRHLLRLKLIPKKGIMQYKKYMHHIVETVDMCQEAAIAANTQFFSDKEVLDKIFQFVETGNLG